jgi:hypothetical protein
MRQIADLQNGTLGQQVKLHASRQARPLTDVADIKKRRKMNLLKQKLIAPLFSKNSKLNE